MFDNIYKNKRVLVTGHTGFKGSWLCFWLKILNAEIAGFALDPPSKPNHFDLLGLEMKDVRGDIRNLEKLTREIQTFRPDIVFHLAAQPLVRYSYEHPLETFVTNVMGTLNLFEACRKTDSVAAIINITSDKCYENKEWVWGYRETDPMGGYDPYSCSKGCAELITASYRKSFFIDKESGAYLASARSGNVIGGGDWGKDRLVPDIIRSVMNENSVLIRNPQAVRPWQHVLEPLSGYLILGEMLFKRKNEFADAWNFGPQQENFIRVKDLASQIISVWDKLDIEFSSRSSQYHEVNMLRIDSSKARELLRWEPVWDTQVGIEKTIEWYKEFVHSGNVLTSDHIHEYFNDARRKRIHWAEHIA